MTSQTQLQYGVMGLGRMGGNLARQALEKRMRVVGFVRRDAPSDLVDAGLEVIRSVGEFRDRLALPRVVFLYIPAGPDVDDRLDELAGALQPGDVLVDGGNSYWGDSIRRSVRLRSRGIRFVDLGTSLGFEGARHGACFMVGGDSDAVALVEPILKQLSVDGGYVHAGPAGAGTLRSLCTTASNLACCKRLRKALTCWNTTTTSCR